MTNPVDPKLSTYMGNSTTLSVARGNESPEDLLLNDPKRFVEKIREDVRQEIGQIDGQKKNVEKMWNEFYEENKDLKEYDWYVQSVLGEKIFEWKDVPVADAKVKLAEESRRRMDLIRNSGMRKEELKSTNAATLPSSGAPASQGSAPAAKETNFIEELIQMKRARNRS